MNQGYSPITTVDQAVEKVAIARAKKIASEVEKAAFYVKYAEKLYREGKISAEEKERLQKNWQSKIDQKLIESKKPIKVSSYSTTGIKPITVSPSQTEPMIKVETKLYKDKIRAATQPVFTDKIKPIPSTSVSQPSVAAKQPDLEIQQQIPTEIQQEVFQQAAMQPVEVPAIQTASAFQFLENVDKRILFGTAIAILFLYFNRKNNGKN